VTDAVLINLCLTYILLSSSQQPHESHQHYTDTETAYIIQVHYETDSDVHSKHHEQLLHGKCK